MLASASMDEEVLQAIRADVEIVCQQSAETITATERVEQLADVFLSYAEGELLLPGFLACAERRSLSPQTHRVHCQCAALLARHQQSS